METRKDGGEYAIDVDISCSRCGYNLRGLDAGGRCPECGTWVGKSLVCHVESRRGEVLLRLEDPAWLVWLMRGCQALLLAMGIWVLLQLVPDDLARWPSRLRWLMTPAAFAAWGLTWVGVMLLTSRSSGTIAEHPGDCVLRWSVRVVVSLYTAIPIGIVLLPRGQYWNELRDFQGVLVVFPGLLATIGFYLWMRNLAMRIPSMPLGMLFLLLSYVLCVSAVVGVRSGGYPSRAFYRPAPLEVLLHLPSPAFGGHEYVHRVIAERRWRYWPNFEPAKVMIAAVPFLTIGGVGVFMLMVKARLREAREGDPVGAEPEANRDVANAVEEREASGPAVDGA